MVVVRVLAHKPLFSLADSLITSHCYFNESKETGFTYGMQVMVEILQPRNSQSLSSSLFLGLVRETGNEVGKDLDHIRHFEVKREILAGDWVETDVKCIVGPPLGNKFASMLKMGPLKQSHNAPSRPGLPLNLKMRNCNAGKL